MLPVETWPAGLMLAALTVYALTGGADFGGGIWDLFAWGPRQKQQRRTIALAIGPIWEANHVWLILVLVLCFVAYPTAYASIGIALHWPLTIMLLGIVLRGTAFVFRSYDSRRDEVQARWSAVFSVASVVSPFMLGLSVAALGSGDIRVDGTAVSGGFFAPWLGPFPFSVGAFVLALFALLAGSYLTLETADPELQEDFRARALAAWGASGLFAWATLLTARTGAPLLYDGLLASHWALPFQVFVGSVALAVAGTLYTRRFRLARVSTMALVTLVVWGWGLAQFPYLIVPDVDVMTAAAPTSAIKPMLLILGVGALPLVGAFWALYAVFKSEPVN
ncbi:MAG: cytochrome d ubiquinol oxidase subunit II [Deltaproteobacteria bacterium]|nr:MAG: cytochrome d ubiquinol oxidase subunit II [Deltaproteobacteria bacterium]